jgi:hypothetical protein
LLKGDGNLRGRSGMTLKKRANTTGIIAEVAGLGGQRVYDRWSRMKCGCG